MGTKQAPSAEAGLASANAQGPPAAVGCAWTSTLPHRAACGATRPAPVRGSTPRSRPPGPSGVAARLRGRYQRRIFDRCIVFSSLRRPAQTPVFAWLAGLPAARNRGHARVRARAVVWSARRQLPPSAPGPRHAGHASPPPGLSSGALSTQLEAGRRGRHQLTRRGRGWGSSPPPTFPRAALPPDRASPKAPRAAPLAPRLRLGPRQRAAERRHKPASKHSPMVQTVRMRPRRAAGR